MSLDAGINAARIASLCIHARFHVHEAEKMEIEIMRYETTCDPIRILLVEDNP